MPSRSRARRGFVSALLLALCVFSAARVLLTAYAIGWAIGRTINGEDVVPEAVYDQLKWSRVPQGWETYTGKRVRKHFRCETRDADQSKPLPSLADRRLMRRKYADTVDPAARFDDRVPPTAGYILNERGPRPYYHKHSKGKGRGLFASRNIRKGEIVHDGDRSDVVFPDGMARRRYAFSLPRDLARDTASWNWTQETEGGGFEIRSPLNAAILMNSGTPNVEPQSSAATEFVATRNISKDEEILYDYRTYRTDRSAFGL